MARSIHLCYSQNICKQKTKKSARFTLWVPNETESADVSRMPDLEPLPAFHLLGGVWTLLFWLVFWQVLEPDRVGQGLFK